MDVLIDGPAQSPSTFLFAHGAGAPMDTPFMSEVARGLAAEGIRVVRFEFPYMAARRTSKKRGGPPDRQPVLLDTFRQVIEEHGGGANVFVGGKSMGGRMATMIADEAGVRGCVCFGYPFHPPGKPEQTRTAHLEKIRTKILIVQGTKDLFGTPDQVLSYRLSRNVRVAWLDGGDHSLKGRLREAIGLAARFLQP